MIGSREYDITDQDLRTAFAVLDESPVNAQPAARARADRAVVNTQPVLHTPTPRERFFVTALCLLILFAVVAAGAVFYPQPMPKIGFVPAAKESVAVSIVGKTGPIAHYYEEAPRLEVDPRAPESMLICVKGHCKAAFEWVEGR